MSEQVTANTMVCSDYQRLLEHRAEIYRSPSVEEATVDEVLRSQVKYAQAYALLRNHVLSCFTCQLDASIA